MASPVFRLLGAQRHHWIDASSTARRDETRKRGDEREETGDDQINRRIERLHFEQDVLERVGEEDAEQERGGAGAQNETNRELPCALLHDHSENAFRIGTERHANAELLGALVHRETHYAVKPDR